jgi:signal transduction histidine kinase
LILARRVQLGGETVVQGCWLDWPAIRSHLIEIVSETLPEAELVPVADSTDRSRVHLSRLLATVPARLVVPEASAEPALLSPIRLSLLGAWTFLLLGTVSVAVLLKGVVTLSERRGAFVSAVTHELRTPLTTFRMYAEMLARGMVPTAEQPQYLETLRVESDRLSHLVENVLEYARLERGRRSSRAESLTLKKLVERVWGRLSDRAAQGEMDLVMEVNDEAAEATVRTDPRAVDQILFNLVDNACKYARVAADRRLHLIVAATASAATFTVRDHGPGISAAAAKKLFRPFSKSVHEAAATAPGVGLGLALSRRLARELGGRLELASAAGPFEGPGAAFTLHLPRE